MDVNTILTEIKIEKQCIGDAANKFYKEGYKNKQLSQKKVPEPQNEKQTNKKQMKKTPGPGPGNGKAHTVRCEFYGLITINRKEKIPPNIMPQGARKRI